MTRPLLPLALLAVLLVPAAAAEWGTYGPDGWPIAADGTSTNPALGDPLNRIGPATAYPYWPVLKAEVERMARDHPDLVRLTTTGDSTLGLSLFLLEIADFARLEAGEGVPLEDRETILIDGGHHSNEYSGVYFPLAWAQLLVEGYETNATAKWIVENRHVLMVPMVNPDGSNAFGRLNAMGVNINRNYPVHWGAIDETPVLNNPGPSAASEPETQAMMALAQELRPDYTATIHCCGNLWLYPYGIEGVDPIDKGMLERVCDEAYPTVREDCGPIWSTIYPTSGSSTDTTYEQVGSAAFAFEMSGRGAVAMWGQPVIVDDVRQQEIESWLGLEHALLNTHRYGAFLEVTEVQSSGGGVLVTLRNSGYGNATRGTLWAGDVGTRPVLLPPVPAGETVQVQVDGHLVPGPSSLRLEYAKRIHNESNSRSLEVPLLVTADGQGEAPPGGYVVAKTADEPLAAVPALSAAVLAVLLGVVALALARRR